MRTKRAIRVSFSDNPPAVNVKLPVSWPELSQQELLDVLRIKAAHETSEPGALLFAVFRYFSGCRVLRRAGEGFLCAFRAAAPDGSVGKITVTVTPEFLAERLACLNFLSVPGETPVRLDEWGGTVAIDAELHGLSFGDYIQLENFYQGFLQSQRQEALYGMAAILYPGIRLKKISQVFVLNVVQWMVQVKAMFARMWPNFFKPATGQESAASMMDVMNSEIRALTGGDVTKESVVFATDCWRALTELDFKAKEAEEFNRKMK